MVLIETVYFVCDYVASAILLENTLIVSYNSKLNNLNLNLFCSIAVVKPLKPCGSIENTKYI